jgi:hypothetical protein
VREYHRMQYQESSERIVRKVNERTNGIVRKKERTMITLMHPRNIQGFPLARCSEHGNISPKPTEIRGKLAVVWACQACEAETKAGKTGMRLPREVVEARARMELADAALCADTVTEKRID